MLIHNKSLVDTQRALILPVKELCQLNVSYYGTGNHLYEFHRPENALDLCVISAVRTTDN